MAILAAPAMASVTIGQLAPSPSGGGTPTPDFLQLAVTSGASYQAPANGTITSWSTNAVAGTGQQLTMKVYRKTADPGFFYKVVGLNGPQPLVGGKVNTFPVSIPVQTGDVLGTTGVAGASIAVLFAAAPGDSFLDHPLPALGLGDEASFFGPNTNNRVNVSAVFQPSNTVQVGTTALNKKKGSAALNLTLPNPGSLAAAGSGVSATPTGAANAGPVQLLINATGKKKKTLKSAGKVSLSVAITFTPTNGDPGTQSVNVKLKKKKK